MTKALRDIQPLLAHAEPEERRLAVQDLVAVRSDEAVALFVNALGDVDWRVRKEAASLTPRVEPKDTLLKALTLALDDRDNIGLRNAAVEALVRLGPDAVPVAMTALDTLNADARKLAVEVLAGIPDARGVTRLVAALDDADPNVVVAAAEALGKAGLASESARAEAAGALTRCLESPNVSLALSALESLVALDARLPYARMRSLSEHPLLRRAAIAAVARTREKPAVGVLVETLADPSSVSREAMLALGHWLRDLSADSAVTRQVGGLLQGNERAFAAVRRAAAEDDTHELRAAALLLIGAARQNDDLPTLVSALDDEELSAAAQGALDLFGVAAAPGLAALLEVASSSTRATLLGLLTALGTPLEARTLRIVRECLVDSSVEVVVAAAGALAECGDERDLGRLVSLTVHGDPRVATAATNAVSALSARHRPTARALLGALDPTADHAAAGAAIVSALARAAVGDPDRGTAELVSFGERALRSADARARRLAVEALAASGADTATERIAVALADEEREVRLAAVRALGTLGATDHLRELLRDSTDEETVSVALRALFEANPTVALDVARTMLATAAPPLASTAVEIFARAPEPHRTEGLLSALGHPDKDVVMLALSELGGALSRQALSRAAVCLTHPAWEVRRLASEIFGEDRSEAARELLLARLELELEPEVREALTVALSIRPPREGGG